MIAKYYPVQELHPGDFTVAGMVVAHSETDIYRERILAAYDAVYSADKKSFRSDVVCNKGEEYATLKSAVLADYPDCVFIN